MHPVSHILRLDTGIRAGAQGAACGERAGVRDMPGNYVHGTGRIYDMVWAILIWLAVVIALVVVVLRLARGESHRGGSYEPVDDMLESEQEARQARSPRVAGTAPSFQPTGRPRHEYRGDDTLDSTMENPVYVNNASVVEVRALFKPEDSQVLKADEGESHNVAQRNPDSGPLHQIH